MASCEIWSDKVILLHIKVTQRGGEHGGESIKTISRRCRRHKELQSRSVRVADSFVINNPPYSPFLCVTFLQSSNLKRASLTPYPLSCREGECWNAREKVSNQATNWLHPHGEESGMRDTPIG